MTFFSMSSYMYVRLHNIFLRLSEEKGLSDSSSGAIFRETYFNEGLKFSIFSYLICRYKCFGSNETNFMDFGQKLWNFGHVYENKLICYFHMGYESNKSVYFCKVALKSTIFDQNLKSWSHLV